MTNQIAAKGSEKHMSRKAIALTSVALAVVLVGVFAAVPAFAQEATPTPDVSPCWPGRGGFRGFGFFGGGSWSVFDAAAKALGLTPEELFAQLREGNGLEDIAEEQGIDIESVHEAMRDVRTEAARERIQQLVDDGTISQEQADWMLEGLDKGFMPIGRCSGYDRHSFGRGMRGGWFHRAPAETVSTELSSS